MISDHCECTISYGSVLVMRVAKVEPSDEIYTMAIPINILGLLAGDFTKGQLESVGLVKYTTKIS